jgi:hypothetical protein
MTVREIIIAYLQEHGYDGLVCSEGECACEIDDLVEYEKAGNIHDNPGLLGEQS